LRLRMLAVAAVAAACSGIVSNLAAAASAGGRSCGWSDYSYAGLLGKQFVAGVSATITPLRDPIVESGHVAAWVGVGGPGLGPGHTDEWIQVGIDRKAGASSRIYYEFATPTSAPHAVTVLSGIRPGEKHRFAVAELIGSPGWWQASVDGAPVGVPVHLPGSHDAWTPIVTAESWDGGARACNAYTYSFDRVSVVGGSGGPWRALAASHVMEDPGYRVVQVAPGSFRAGIGA
jgi:hypothetical protein